MSSTMLSMLADHASAGMIGPAGVSLSLAFGAGVLSTLNPCGFALLPAFISYTVKQQVSVASERGPENWRSLLRGGLLGLPLTAGFLLIFLVAGGVLALGGRLLVHLFPWLALGQAEASPHVMRAAWIFGLGYGLSSLGCTLPVFLLVVGTTITAGGVADAGLVLASYAAGMALVLFMVALAATTLGDVLRSTIFPLLRWVQPVAALLLMGAGGYIVFYQLHAGLW